MKARFGILLLSAALTSTWAPAQVLWVPGGASTGVGNNSTNSFVGLGISAPATPLQLHSSNGSESISIALTNADSGGSGNDGLLLQLSGDEDAYVFQRENRSLFLGTNDQTRLTISADGNVGIGTTTPGQRLEMHKAGNAILAIRQPDSPAPGKYAQLTLTQGSTFFGANDRSWQIVSKGLASGEADLALQYWSGNYAVHTTFTGNVGIGTMSPSHKLAVNGTVRAHEVIVDTGWADHVFADDYQLASLDEIEAHIREKRHLPGIPSAAEVAEHGISVGEMQAKLLGKIEELTLHQIAQAKRLDAQAARIAALEAENNALRSRRQ